MITRICLINYLHFCICLLLLCSCNQKQRREGKDTARAFYYWKSVFKLTDYEKKAVDSLHVSALYLKFFDVDWNEVTNQPNPAAQIRVIDSNYLRQKDIIPVVFITNECILKIDPIQSVQLAEKIYKLINDICVINKLSKIREIQIDCDWTASTKEKYFSILKRIKEQATGIKVSATIRLHQVKFMTKCGVPPVDRGLLLCYNMGNLKNSATDNSIIEPAEIKKYIANLDHYPLSLDVAMPLFDWWVLIRNNNYTGLVRGLPTNIFDDSFVKRSDNRYSFLKDTILVGYTFKKNDVLRYENSEYNSIMASAKLVNDRLQQNDRTVSLYHLDSITLSKYSVHEMENIFNSIH